MSESRNESSCSLYDDDALISCRCFLCGWFSTQINNFDNLHTRLRDMIFDAVNDSQKHFKAICYFKVISNYRDKVYYNIREFTNKDSQNMEYSLMKENIFFFRKKKKSFFKKKRQTVFILWSIKSFHLQRISKFKQSLCSLTS